jgi:HEAT repeat protein
VQTLITSNPLQHAQESAQNGDWSQFSQVVQELFERLEHQPMTKPIATERSPELILRRADDIAQPALDIETVDDIEDQLHQIFLCLLDVLEAGDFRDRWDVAKLIPMFGKRAIAPLLERLQDDEIELEVRWFIARTLGDLPDPQVLDALIEVLITASDTELCNMCAAAIANFGRAAIAPLTDLLGNESIRLLAVRALCQIRQAETVPSLLAVVADPDANVREMAIEALTGFDDSRIAAMLPCALTDPSAKVRRAAVTGLGLHPGLIPEHDLVPLMQPLLYDLNLDVCRQSAIALGRLSTDDAAVALFETLRSPHTPLPLKVDLIRALGWMETPTALAYLHQALMQPEFEPVVYQEIVSILSRVEQSSNRSRVAAYLIDVLQSDHPALQQARFKQAIALALGQLNVSVAIDPLIQLLADPDLGTRLHVVSALKHLEPAQAYDRLQTLVQQADLSTNLRQGITLALQEW